MASDSLQPDSRSSKSVTELTIRAVILRLVLFVVMRAANVYVGLKAGMIVSASIPAAVMAVLLFRLLLGIVDSGSQSGSDLCVCR